MTPTKVEQDRQDFGHDPIATRESDHYTAEYVHGFVKKWDALIDWDKRAESEGEFFVQLLKDRGVKRVLDVATGTGFHSVQLQKAGFEVHSADGSLEMLSQAFKNGMDHGFALRTIRADWRWLCRDVHAKFDAVVCLGNSFTHLFDEFDRRKALAEFYSVLKHDGILVLDQRNYDAILDEGFDSKHVYYYCGEEVSAAPEHVDEGLARFCYTFPDGQQYHLNMFPLRTKYMTDLMKNVGFTDVRTYGDFKETYHVHEPDFLVHVAEKSYSLVNGEDEQIVSTQGGDVAVARDYYNSDDADRFYHLVWGGEDIHIGLYESPNESIRDASARTVRHMAKKVDGINELSRVLDVGSGYAGSSRYLSKTFGCHVSALNLSETQNERARQLNEDAGLGMMILVADGSFDDIPAPDDCYDVVWCQDAILHSDNRFKVFQEIDRVLAPGGQFIMTDPMAGENPEADKLQPILDRIKLPSLGSVAVYKEYAEKLGWKLLEWEDMTDQLVNHYSAVRSVLELKGDELVHYCSAQYLENMSNGLQRWIDGGKDGTLQWGVLHFRKP